jgi:hypothetical protein
MTNERTIRHAAMPVIVGVPRSGTTLLRFMLDSHPILAIPPETTFLPAAYELRQAGRDTWEDLFDLLTAFPRDAPAWPDFGLEPLELQEEFRKIHPFGLGEGLRAFYRLYASKQNKPRYGDKTPSYCEHIPSIASLLPEAHFIHIIRDGRDVAMSLRKMWFAPGHDVPTLARYWRRLVRGAREAGGVSRAYMEIRYEDLVTEPQSQLEAITRFLSIPFDSSMLRYFERTPERLKEHRARVRVDGAVLVSHEQRLSQQRLTTQSLQPSRVFQWKREMSEAERAEFVLYAGDTLEELGYKV